MCINLRTGGPRYEIMEQLLLVALLIIVVLSLSLQSIVLFLVGKKNGTMREELDGLLVKHLDKLRKTPLLKTPEHQLDKVYVQPDLLERSINECMEVKISGE